MMRLLHIQRSLLHEEDGATAIEYALIAALVCVTLITSLTFFGGQLKKLLDHVGISFPI